MENKNIVVIKRKKILLDDYFKIDEAYLQIEKFDGKISKEFRRLNFKREDACCALLYDKEIESVLLIKQFRYPSYTKEKEYLFEIPAGINEFNENPKDTIIREIVEETGFVIHDPTLIFTFFTSPGITSERCFLFYSEVDQLSKKFDGGGLENENEDIQTYWIPKSLVLPMLKSGKIRDAKTVIALQWFILSFFC